MRRIVVTLSLPALLLAALALPTSASASHLARADFKSVSKYCKALRAEMGAKSFKRAFGKGKHKRRAHRTCVARRGVIQKVSLRSQILPSPDCPPGTVPEPPQPVSAFVVSPVVCVAIPPAALPPAQPVDDDDEDEDEEAEDQDSDDDESGDDDRDDDDSDDDD